MNQSLQRLTLADRELAYQQRNAEPKNGSKPSVFFMGGFSSDMSGSKATFLDSQCAQAGYGYTRFDYRGHGASSGKFEEGCIGDWLDDALKIFDGVTCGKQILVGSSMGGWIGLLLAKARPQRIAGFVGVAAAPDFTEDLIRPTMTPEQEAQMETEGYFYEEPAPPSGEPDTRLPITRRLMEDGRGQLVLLDPIALSVPVRLIQGQQDTEVPWQTALRIAENVDSADVRVTLIKDGEHRLSRTPDLALLWQNVVELVGD